MSKFSIVVPAYNEGESIAEVLRELMETCSDCEIVVVDDGSSDDTSRVAGEFSSIVLVRHNKNRGQGASIKTGIRQATGDYVILVDADGQHPTEGVRDIISSIGENPGLDAVLTERSNLYSSGWLRSMGKIVINFVVKKLTGENIRDNNCGLRAFRRNAILPFLFMLPDRFSFSTISTVLAYKEGYEIKWIEVEMRKRKGGVSQVRVRHGFDTLILVFRLIVLFDPLSFFVPISVYSFFLGLISISLGLATAQSLGKNYIFFFLFSSLAFILGLLSEQVANIRKEIINNKR